MIKDVSWLYEKPTAHRGLHNNKDLPENTMAAFKKAVENGYNIEFDVWLTDDNHLIIHHDNTLKRTCGIKMHPTKIDCSKIEQYKVMGTDEHIPFFEDFLKMVDGKINLICEIKPTKRVEETCIKVYETFQKYNGKYCIESFDPRVVNWWHENHPEIILGQLYDNMNHLQRWYCLLKHQEKKVDFLAVCVKNLPYKPYIKIKKNNPEKIIVTWTVRTNEDLEKAKKYADAYIFECNDKNPEYIEKPSLT